MCETSICGLSFIELPGRNQEGEAASTDTLMALYDLGNNRLKMGDELRNKRVNTKTRKKNQNAGH